MKKIHSFIFAAIMIAAVSCKRSEEITPTTLETSSSSKVAAVQAALLSPVLVAGFKDHAGYANASGASALFNQPFGIFVNTDGTLLVADQKNGAIRKITNSVVSTVTKNTVLVGISNIAGTKDGTIALNDKGSTVLYKANNLNIISFPGCQHCSTGGVSKSADGTFFWYVNNLYDGESAVNLEAIRPDGSPGGGQSGAIASSDDASAIGNAVSTSLNDNKFVTLAHGVYELTHSGALLNILTPTTFDGITDIAVNKDGTKLYLADNGDIKLITRCPTCPTVLTVLATHVDATGLALSNSEKVLFFTSPKHHTISKLNLP
jgi:hypothetical protein